MAPWWLPGGHLQSIVPAFLMRRRPAVQYRRERWDTRDGDFVRDGDFIDIDFASPEPVATDAPLLVLFHGLEGSSRGHYARSTMRFFADRGWRALVVHFRSCSGEMNRLPRAYHAGDYKEGDWILRAVHARWPEARLYAVGVSLGGNMLAKWAGERGDSASFVTAAASISAPLDLKAGGEKLRSGFNKIYTRHFLCTLRPKVEEKLRRFPDLARDSEHAKRMREAHDLYEFDNEYTAPVHGFHDVEDSSRDVEVYWERASAKPGLGMVRIPYLLLNALNDPFVPRESLPRVDQVSPLVELDQPAEGGHMGFPRGPWPGNIDFVPERLHHFFSRHGSPQP